MPGTSHKESVCSPDWVASCVGDLSNGAPREDLLTIWTSLCTCREVFCRASEVSFNCHERINTTITLTFQHIETSSIIIVLTAGSLTGVMGFFGGTTETLWRRETCHYYFLFLFNSITKLLLYEKRARLTTANGNDIIIILVVVYLDDLGGQLPSTSFILWAAIPIDEAVFLVGRLHKLLALQ